ncbi:alpha/beta fold hydrolase [Ornithinibacillus halotolerans]|uniref:Alpha/beta hydrolase n=1 Tax=Ornithinibacillus halotolerans TaxID=1274357 RepID=A0A916S2X4_9BACI|nr:alpha/beta hydrolase [Ornithinibacillus halotolerans]GGA80869.1 alpha/beta hydrolase [Ornithinibacillus halotolerans]
MILHSISTGTGEPIILLHQGLQTGDTDFQEQREAFSKVYQVIQVDLRGHGKSVTNDFDDYFEKSAVDLSETLNYLEIEKAHIVGSSLGSLVGLVFAKRFPNKVKSLVITGIFPEQPENWDQLLAEQTAVQNKVIEEKETVDYLNTIHQGDWVGLLKFSQQNNWYPFEETKDLSSLSMPTLFLVGEENPAEVIGAMIYPKQNKNIHVAVIPFAGHLPQWQQPEIFNSILEKFLQYTK